MFSSDLNKHLAGILVDEKRNHVLTRITKSKRGIKVKESDHNVIITEFDCKTKDREENVKEEVYNLKNKTCQEMFKKLTSETSMLSSSIEEEGDIDKVIKRFLKKLNGCIGMAFKKNRVNHDKAKEEDILYDKRRELKGKEDDESKTELENVNKAIAEANTKNFEKLKDELSKLKKVDGKINSKELWKLKKAMCPKMKCAPSAMNDSKGNLLTSEKAIKNRALEVYAERLEGNQIEPHLTEYEEDINTVCEMRVKTSKNNKTNPWTMEDLIVVLKELPKGKSRDPEGYANEIFRDDVAGHDLKEALLKIMNMIKTQQKYPSVMEKCNITSLHKKKSKRDFDNYRGVFRVQILRSILDKLMYNDSYYTIDSNLTDGNVGARKERSVRDNIFVISAITNSVRNGTSAPIQVQVMDAVKCFTNCGCNPVLIHHMKQE